METKFTFVRHGRAWHNEDFDIRGEHAYYDPVNVDARLTQKGEVQAKALQGLFKPRDFDIIFCSPLRRCTGTLRLAFPESEGLPVNLDDRLMEPQGDAECNRRLGREDLIGDVPTCWVASEVAPQNPFVILNEGYTTGAAGFERFSQRIKKFTEWLMANHRGKRILIVGHHDWIKTWHIMYMGKTVSPMNCEIVESTLTTL
jgi:broad specificity phosphatase PhoE